MGKCRNTSSKREVSLGKGKRKTHQPKYLVVREDGNTKKTSPAQFKATPGRRAGWDRGNNITE